MLGQRAHAISVESDEKLISSLAGLSDWDVATRFQELARSFRAQHPNRFQEIRDRSVRAIFERAKEILGSAVRPETIRVVSLGAAPELEFSDAEIDYEETVPNILLARASNRPLQSSDIWVSAKESRSYQIILCVDTSLSMTGEKFALTAVAIAVVLLQFPNDALGVVAFENEARILKRIQEKITIKELLERFLDLPSEGYTHLEEGLRKALELIREASSSDRSSRVSTILLSDGKYTAGKDPAYLAKQFDHLMVLKMGKDRSSHDLCQELARGGAGALKEIADLEDLPLSMYELVKDVLRGRTLSGC